MPPLGVLVDVFLSNAGDRGRGRKGFREEVIAGTARGSGFARERPVRLLVAAWAFRIGRTAFRVAAYAARSGNHQPWDNRQERPIGPFILCLRGARTKEGDIRANFDPDAGVDLILAVE